MVGGIPKPAEILEAVGNGIKGAEKDRRNGAGPGSDVQDGGEVGALVCHRDMGGDRLDVQGPGGVPSPGSTTYHRDNGEIWGRRIVGVPPSSEGNAIRGDPPHRGVH